jgi:iron complex outermembrane receptor protein
LTSGGVVGNGAVTSNPLFYDANNWWSSVNPAYLGTPVVLNAANLATSGSATSFTGSESAAWDLWTYDITPEYKITKDAMVYFKHAKGAKSGGFNTAATQLAAINTIIKPESIFSYELGAKTTWFEGRLKANTALFYYDYSNDQLNITAVPDPSIPNNRTGYIYNVKSAHSQGAEFSVEALPIPDLHIWANVGLLDTRFDDVSNINQGTVTDTRTLIQEGNDFVRSPHVTSFLQADYRIPYELPGDTHLILSGDWRFQDKQYYYVNYQDNSPLSSKLWQSPYSLVNFRVTLASKDDKYNIVAYVNNAFDEVYRNHTNTPSAGNLNGATLTWGQPQTAGVQVTARFW